ncbi:MAG: exodeoxyribonuclease VII small subunit [Atopobiaceae bacterium]|nr:exodeoxyribonuclease VII small subunit [Atopobiaceae bacterium]
MGQDAQGSHDRAVEELSFKEASIELEHIVRGLESGELELEESLKNYERGVELLSSLRERLSTAEQQVEQLLETHSSASAIDTTSAPSQAFIDE